MKIPLLINEDRLELESIVHAPKYRTGIPLITFIVDTGSSRSFIGYGDALKLHLPINHLEFKEHMRFGGTKFGLYKMKGVYMSFLNEENRAEKVELGEFYVAKPTKGGEERFLAQQLPSIIGLDFLIKNCYSLHVNPSKDISYMEG